MCLLMYWQVPVLTGKFLKFSWFNNLQPIVYEHFRPAHETRFIATNIRPDKLFYFGSLVRAILLGGARDFSGYSAL